MVGNLEATRDKNLKPWNEDFTVVAAPAALVADAVLLTRWVILADEANTDPVLLGNADGQLFPLKPGSALDGTYLGHNPALVYGSGTVGDVLHLLGCE